MDHIGRALLTAFVISLTLTLAGQARSAQFGDVVAVLFPADDVYRAPGEQLGPSQLRLTNITGAPINAIVLGVLYRPGSGPSDLQYLDAPVALTPFTPHTDLISDVIPAYFPHGTYLLRLIVKEVGTGTLLNTATHMVVIGDPEVCNGVDDDGDGDVDEGFDEDGDGWTTCDGDCDDADAAINPDAVEDCLDGVDNDCDGDVDAFDIDCGPCPDADADGYQDEACGGLDCDDTDPDVNPGAVEMCDGVDNDCDGSVDGNDAADVQPWYVDADSDGYGHASLFYVQCYAPSGYVANSTDCDDADAAINPGADEMCDDIDNDCDGDIDEESAIDATIWYQDADGDGYGDPGVPDVECDQPTGYVSDSTDCDDTTVLVNPSADEICDWLDNDCDGAVDDADTDLPADADNDGVPHCGDCDDSDASVFSGAAGVTDVPGDFATIQGAINAAASGDTICVAVGTYAEALDFGGKAVLVTGSHAAVVDATGLGMALTFDSGEGPDSEVRGLSLTNGSSTYGGGIYITDSSPTVTGTRVHDNLATYDGGGIYVAGPSSVVTLDGVILTSNVAYWGNGGGLFIWDGAVVSLDDALLRHNECSSTYCDGGGAHVDDDSVLDVAGTVFRENRADERGGGLYYRYATGTVTDSEFIANWVDGDTPYGGGLMADYYSVVDMSGLVVQDNSAYWGGGLVVMYSDSTLHGATISGNVANASAGAWNYESSSVWTGLLVTDNHAVATSGGGISFGGCATCELRDSVISGNSAVSSCGGGLSAGDYYPGTVHDNLIISDNTARYGAGLVFYGSGTLTNSVISGNLATSNSSTRGGGISVESGSPEFENVIVSGNEAIAGTGYASGGGISVSLGSDAPVFRNVAVIGNYIGDDGWAAGMYIDSSSSPTLTNVLITANELGPSAWYGGLSNGSATAVITYCNSWGNDGVDYNPDIEGINGNISADPELLDITAADPLGWDLHVSATSACVDAGDFGLSDPDGSRSDIGAYGGPGAELYDLDLDGHYEWWQPGPYDPVTYPALGWDCDDLDEEAYPGNGC